MPLYAHTGGERVRTVPGSAEDGRLRADPAWHLDGEPAPAVASDRPDDVEPDPTDDGDVVDGPDGAPAPQE